MYMCQPKSVPRVTSWFFWIFYFIFFEFFFKSSRVNLIVCHMLKSIFYIQFGPYIYYFCSIRSQFLLTLTNLVPIKDVTKLNFYMKVIMMWILIYYIKIFKKNVNFNIKIKFGFNLERDQIEFRTLTLTRGTLLGWHADI